MCARQRRAVERLRIIALTGPIAAGVIDSRSMPSPISAIASSGRPPISPHTARSTLASRTARTTRFRKRRIDGRQPVVAFGELGIGAVGGEQELGKVVGADRQEIELGQQQVELFGERRHFEHRAIADLGRQLLAAAVEPGALRLEQGARLVEFPRLR